MKRRIPNQTFPRSMPNPPEVFSNAMRETLRGIVQAEAQKENQSMKKLLTRRKIMLYAVIAAVLVASVAFAAALLSGNVFDYTMGTTPQNAESITQYDLVKEVIGNAEVSVKEAAYDGMSLFISYSIRDLNAAEPMGVYDEASGMRLLTEEDYQRINSLGVGWWVDNIWIDGQSVDMPGMSGGIDVGTETPGEIIYAMQYRLDQEDLYLNGNAVEISLPIGERQSLDSLIVDREKQQILLPEKGMVSFTLDCSVRDQITTLNPEWETAGERWRAKVREAVFTPIQTYITVDWAVDEAVMQAYIAENGEGYKDENGVIYWMFDGVDAVGFELQSLQLVDKNGVPVFKALDSMEGFYGNQGIGATVAYFTFPYTDALPDELYLAPTMDDKIDMSYAIRIK